MFRISGWKRLISMMLLCSLLAGILPLSALAEGVDAFPHLTLQASFAEADDQGNITLQMELGFYPGAGSHAVTEAQDVVVTVGGDNGLPETIGVFRFNRFSAPQKMEKSCSYSDPKDRKPGDPLPEEAHIYVHVTSANCGTLEYKATLNIQPTCRVLIIQQHSSNFLTSDQDDATSIVSDGFFKSDGTLVKYDGLPIIGKSVVIGSKKTEDDNIWHMIDFAFSDADDNDISYLFLITHGLSTNFQPTEQLVFQSDPQKDIVSYREILSYLQEHVKGRMVISFDNCFSGAALQAAKELNLDPERFSIITATEAHLPESTGISASSYFQSTAMSALYNKLQREGRRQNKGYSTIEDFHALSQRWGQILSEAGRNSVSSVGYIFMLFFWLVDNTAEGLVNGTGDLSRMWRNFADWEQKLKQGIKLDVLEIIKTLVAYGSFQGDDAESLWDVWSAFWEARKTGRTESFQDKLLHIFNILCKYAPARFLSDLWLALAPYDLDYPDYSSLNATLTQSLQEYQGYMHPLFYGDTARPLFLYDDSYDDHYRRLVFVKSDPPVVEPGGGEAIADLVMSMDFIGYGWDARVYLLNKEGHLILREDGYPASVSVAVDDVPPQTCRVYKLSDRAILVECFDKYGQRVLWEVRRLNAQNEPELVSDYPTQNAQLLLTYVGDYNPPTSEAVKARYYVPANTPQSGARPIDALLAELNDLFPSPELIRTAIEAGSGYTEEYASGGVRLTFQAAEDHTIAAILLDDSRTYSVTFNRIPGMDSPLMQASDLMLQLYQRIVSSQALACSADRAALLAFQPDSTEVTRNDFGLRRETTLENGDVSVRYLKYFNIPGSSFTSLINIQAD